MTDASNPQKDDEETTDPSELSKDGVGATMGEKDTFEPEESENVEE